MNTGSVALEVKHLNINNKLTAEKTHNDVVGEPRVQRNHALQKGDLFVRQGNIKCLDIGHKVLYLASADDWETVWDLLQKIGDSDWVTMSMEDS
jgi:hypothetical protein